MARTSPRGKNAAAARRSHNQWLVLIALFKFAQALVFIFIGFGAHRLLKKDIADEIELFARHLRFNPESRLINFILEKASLVNDPLLRRISFAAFGYSALCIAEGLGLYLEKAWGEFLTLAITASFLPWEVFEVYRRLTWLHVGLLIINVLVFIYLLKLLGESTKAKMHVRKTR
ncbi:MAG TPA: DUF2127 domain-containing protein [Terracidiphilus sp.]|nr:DUF2127 domain-containing protein [Terracidiphilus sp.]